VGAGDRLIVTNRWASDVIETVERVTKTQVMTKRSKYRRDSGIEVGSERFARRVARPASTDDIERIRHERRVAVAVSRITAMTTSGAERDRLSALPPATLEAAIALLEGRTERGTQ
jgi:hypothetical protein